VGSAAESLRHDLDALLVPYMPPRES
jgi:hypothetical protein